MLHVQRSRPQTVNAIPKIGTVKKLFFSVRESFELNGCTITYVVHHRSFILNVPKVQNITRLNLELRLISLPSTFKIVVITTFSMNLGSMF